jgi:hypothetical protein
MRSLRSTHLYGGEERKIIKMDVVSGCPKFMKNGPCGGYRGGRCEVYPEKKCIFIAAWERNPDSLRREL